MFETDSMVPLLPRSVAADSHVGTWDRPRGTAALLCVIAVLITTSTLSASEGPRSPFVRVCGTGLCINERPFLIHGATAYGQYNSPDQEVSLAKSANLNVLEIVEFEQNHHRLSDAMSEVTWARVDRFIARAQAGGLRVILNFSSYGQSLQSSGIKPTIVDWGPFLSFVTHRVNTVTRKRYSDDPTIIMYELFGEIDAPNYRNPTRGTSAETTAFFRRTLAELKALDSHHLASTGGLSYINDPRSGIDWRTIMSDPNDDVCGVEVNSYPDRNISVPSVSGFCKSKGKPWFLAAWSACDNAKQGSYDINDWPNGDADMAAHATDMYQVERDAHPARPAPAMAAVGSDFWNLQETGTCALGPSYPQTLTVVRRYIAPLPALPLYA